LIFAIGAVVRRTGVADAVEFLRHTRRRPDISVGPVPKIELHAGRKRPLERYIVDRDHLLPAVHGRGKVVGRIELGALVGNQAYSFDRPGLAFGQILRLKTPEKRHEVRDGCSVVDVINPWPIQRRIRDHVVLKRNREVDALS
jgi:hypothetical protein